MQNSKLSPKQAAKFLGVSESSLKRWCDSGRIKATKTPGGHRKIEQVDLVEFARAHHGAKIDVSALAALEVNGSHRDLKSASHSLALALLSGNEVQARQQVIDLYADGYPVSKILDEVITSAFREIGDLWECANAESYQERQSCEICRRILFELRQVILQSDDGPIAIGATLEGDIYQLPTTMVELVLRTNGYRATSLGSSIPATSFANAIRDTGPALVWLSTSFINDESRFVNDVTQIANLCSEQNISLVMGGNGLHNDFRRRFPNVSFCESMQHLESKARTLLLGLIAKSNPSEFAKRM